jgi:hypothetical protein
MTAGDCTMLSPLQLAPVFDLTVRVGEAHELGETGGGRRRTIPILGGELHGFGDGGIVLPGGADWQTLGSDGVTHLHARYAIRMSNGDIVGVSNRGVRRASPDIAERMAAGIEVDHSRYYFVTTPIFEAAHGAHRWLSEHVFLARGLRFPDRVCLQVFRVDC